MDGALLGQINPPQLGKLIKVSGTCSLEIEGDCPVPQGLLGQLAVGVPAQPGDDVSLGAGCSF